MDTNIDTNELTTQEIADILNADISETLHDAGVDTLTQDDPEYKDFRAALDQGLIEGNGADIIRAAAKAGTAKAARLKEKEEKPVKSAHDYRRRVSSERQTTQEAPSLTPDKPIKSAHDYMKRVSAERNAK